ncbi:MAG: hypothetical protein D6815_13015 [Candidatus Dadabacteria bacterium]|nr:MAG: hypothetical protein D6815_13015 [Candidatus Dadabacteria bacterium]
MAPGTVELVFVVRDPSFSRERSWVGCEDGHVCPWCHDDPSAKRFRHFYGKAFGSFLTPDAVGRYPVFFTNAVLHGRGRNRAPTAGERRACRPVLERQIELVRPRAVVALGHHACQSVAGIYGLSSEALLSATQPLRTREGPWLWGTYHPSPLAASKSDEIAAKFAAIATWLERFERL